MKVHVSVSQEDIDKARWDRYDSTRCPIARAIRRDMNRDDVHVSSSGAFSASLGSGMLPQSAQVAIHNFDRGDGMSPLEFDVDLK